MPGKDRVIAWWVFLFFLASFLLVSNGRFGGDGIENYFTAESIVLDRDLSIHDRPFEVKEMHCVQTDDINTAGKFFSSYGLGMALILVPFYFIGHLTAEIFKQIPHDYITQFAVSLANPVILSLLAVVLFKLLRELQYSLKVSFISIVIYSFCTMSFIYVRSGFAEPMICLLVVMAALEMFRFYKNNDSKNLLFAGICIGYAIFIKKNSLILFPAFLIYFLYLVFSANKKEKRVLNYAAFFFPIVCSFIAILIQNKLMYGGIAQTEFGGIHDTLLKIRTDGHPIKGLCHYLFSTGKGYLIYNIALIPAIFAIKDFFKKEKNLCIFIFSLVALNIAYYSWVFTRDSLFSWGPRYLLPTLPLFTLFFAEFIEKKKTMVRKITIGIFASLGFLIQLPAALMNYSGYLFMIRDNLKLPEYLINYVPDLSPIKGTLSLLLSFINCSITGKSLNFIYNPDFKFINSISTSLSGFDLLDTWWSNAYRVNHSLLGYLILAGLILVYLIFLSYSKITSESIRQNV